ncbi:serine/threonine-protein phosphatase PGAM5, mitochondrial-like [Thrips palmi]|uniref:Serine/threonine-protein phosphatase PGAM5, mitochondrial n=1 Tax=Thrips palmi TaxID=161013 RepID=A0A6P8ZPK6_THRPL|nr:serine/threonine-protein phosphatase PGAM5, mitochondrial-like [Thrips palmi]
MAVLGKLMVAGLGGLGGLTGVLYASTVLSDTKTVVQASQKISNLKNKRFETDYNGSYEPAITKWDFNWDRRDPSSMVSPSKGGEDDIRHKRDLTIVEPKAVRHLLLIRHGQYNIDGNTDKEMVLTKKGVEQAKLTGKRLVTLNFPYTKMMRSTMTRAQQTADHILSQMKPGAFPISDDKMLEEGAPYPPEPSVYGYDPLDYEFFQDGSRIEAAFRNHVYRADFRQLQDSYDIIVCHGNVIRYFVCRALQLPPEAWLRMDLRHGSITWLSVWPNGLVSLRCLGDSGHFPPDLLT